MLNRIKRAMVVIGISTSITINFAIFIILFSPLNREIHELMHINSDLPEKLDVIIILSSNFPHQTPNGMPDLATMVRIEKGIRLYREGYANKIIAFGGIWVESAKKTAAQLIKERLVLFGIPEQDVHVQDQVMGKMNYYENILHMIDRFKQYDFKKAAFVTTIDQSWRIHHALLGLIKRPLVVTGEPYELYSDWGQRFHVLRRITNEIMFALPYFWITGRFSNPSTYKWVIGNPHLHKSKT